MKRKQKRMTEKAVSQGYWDGFFKCLAGDESLAPALEYASTNPMARYQEPYNIAYRAGVELCLDVLKRRGGRFSVWVDREIPGKVYAESYGAMRLT